MSFWDFIADYPRVGSDSFGDYVRLMKKGTVGRPRAVESLEELRAVLRQERVEFDIERIKSVWKAYRYAMERRAHRSLSDS